MKLEAKMLVDELERTFNELLPLVKQLEEFCAQENQNCVELVDVAFACREATRHIDVMQKALNGLSKRAQSFCSITMAMTGEDIIRTDYCSASSNPKPWFRCPYKRAQDPDTWDEIMEAVGVPQMPNEKDIVRLNLPGLMDYCAELIGEGGQPPAGIDPKKMTGMQLNLRITKKR